MRGHANLLISRLLNQGVLAPGDSPGTFLINGNLTLGSASVLEMEIEGLTPRGDTGGYDFIDVNGDLALDGTLRVLTTPYAGQSPGHSYELIRASGSVSGSFATTDAPDGYGYDQIIDSTSPASLLRLTLNTLPGASEQVSTLPQQEIITLLTQSLPGANPLDNNLGADQADDSEQSDAIEQCQ